MKSEKILCVVACAAAIVTACQSSSPAASPGTAEPRSTEKNYCEVKDGVRQCYHVGNETDELREAQSTCDCDGDGDLDSEGLRSHPLCQKYYLDAHTDTDLCHSNLNGTVTGGSSGFAASSGGAGTSNGGSGGGTSNGGTSNAGTASSTSGGSSTSLDRCDPRNGIIPVDCNGGGSSSSSGGMATSTASSGVSTGGNGSSFQDPCDPRNGIIPAYCGNWSGSSSGGSSATSMTASSGTAATSASASAGSSGTGGQSSSNNPVLWQFKDICSAAPGGYGNWDVLRPAGRDAQGNIMVDFNLCQLLWAFDTQEANLRCDPNLPIRWVGTDVNAEAGRTGSDLLNFNYAFGRNVGPVIEQSAGHVWARYVPTAVTQNRVVEGVLRCSSPGGFGDLQSAVQHGRSLDFINVVSQNPFNARMIFTQTPQASGGSTSSSSGGTGNSMGTASSMGSTATSNTGGNASSTTGSSATSTTGGPTGGPVGYELGRPDPQVPGAVLFNIRNFSATQQQYFLLNVTKAVCLSCTYATGIQAELVFKQDNTVEEIRVLAPVDGVYEWTLSQSANGSSTADFNTPCENGVGGPSCRKYTNITTWYSGWSITTVNGVRRAVARGGVDGQPGVSTGSAVLKAFGSGGNRECKPDLMTSQVLHACTEAIPVLGTGISVTDLQQFVGLYYSVSNDEVEGFKVVYNDTCVPEQMFCQQNLVIPANPGELQLFATPRKPFRIVVKIRNRGEFTLNLSYVNVPRDPVNTMFTCPYGQHFEEGACRPNTRLSVVTVNNSAFLEVDAPAQ